MAKFYHDDLLPTRIKIVNKALLEYNAMQLSPYELFLAKSQELEAERNYIDTLRDYWITRAKLERTVGGKLTPRNQPPSLEKPGKTTKEKSHEESTALTRRHFVGGTAFLAGAAALPSLLRAQNAAPPAEAYHFNEAIQPAWTKAPLAPGEPGKDYKPTVTLNGSTLPFRVVDGVKVFHLTCEEVDHVFVPRTE